VTPADYRILHINPEEDATTPAERLVAQGVPLGDPDTSDRYLGLHTRDARLYFNRPSNVSKVLDLLDSEGWLDDPRPLIVMVDGTQPTLSGKLWNEDLEAWKEGIGAFRLAANPAALYVRTQTTSAASRRSKKRADKPDEGAVEGEDAAGGQIFQWPDTRLILNRTGDDRRLTVRGRRVFSGGQRVPEWEAVYTFDPDTFDMRVIERAAYDWATVRTALFLNSQWRNIDRGTSARGVAEHLAKIDRNLAKTDAAYTTVSASTYRRALQGWKHDPEADAWRLTSTMKTATS
jgi:hypothetical protein